MKPTKKNSTKKGTTSFATPEPPRRDYIRGGAIVVTPEQKKRLKDLAERLSIPVFSSLTEREQRLLWKEYRELYRSIYGTSVKAGRPVKKSETSKMKEDYCKWLSQLKPLYEKRKMDRKKKRKVSNEEIKSAVKAIAAQEKIEQNLDTIIYEARTAAQAAATLVALKHNVTAKYIRKLIREFPPSKT